MPERTIVAIVGAVDPDARARAGARGLRRLAGRRRRGGSLAGGAGAPRGAGAHAARRRDARPSCRSAGARRRRCTRRAGARPGRGGARLGPRQLALPAAARARARHLGRRRITTRRPSSACSASRAELAPGAGAEALDGDRRDGRPAHAARAPGRGAGAGAHAAPRALGPPAGVDGGSGRRARRAPRRWTACDLLDREYDAIARPSPPDDVRDAAARYLAAGRGVRGGLPAPRTRATISPPIALARAFAVTGAPATRAAPAASPPRPQSAGTVPPGDPARGRGGPHPACRAPTCWCAASRACRSSRSASTCPAPAARPAGRRPGSARSPSASAVRGAGDLDAARAGLRVRASGRHARARARPPTGSASAPRCWPSTWRTAAALLDLVFTRRRAWPRRDVDARARA